LDDVEVAVAFSFDNKVLNNARAFHPRPRVTAQVLSIEGGLSLT
jgi:hypothetical protein